MPEAFLLLADGSVFRGKAIGADGDTAGEVVFNTGMTGYQEMLTDPSYAGQLLVLTYPIIGSYGIDGTVEESARVQPAGVIVREAASYASHNLATGTLDSYLKARGVPGIAGVDTRAITRKIRREGVMPGLITTSADLVAARERLASMPDYDSIDWVANVTSSAPYTWRAEGEPLYRVALVDGGVKRSILRALTSRGCEVEVFPAYTPAEEILAKRPDGVVLSPGPGDPRVLEPMVQQAGQLVGKAPLFGICLGHQVLARAMGAKTFKLPFGHRGGNHPVRDLTTGRVTITSQNHGYAVDPDGLDSNAYVSHINVNDETVEGIALRNEPVMTLQYHSEACPGPLDNDGIFDRFVEMMAAVAGGVK